MHAPSVLLIAATANASASGVLFWVLVVGAVLWYLIWLLLHGRRTSSETETPEAATGGPDTASEGSSASHSPPMPVPETAPEPAPAPTVEAETSPETPAEDDESESDLPSLETATAEQAGEQFKAEIESGKARFDDNYGIVYTSAPEKPDDLKKIKGVAKVLEGKLNGHGVYTYRQIAFWTDPAVREFSKLLTNFKDRIYRDNWIAQARELHEEKYEEKL